MRRIVFLGLALSMAGTCFGQSELYQVVDGYKVDAETLKGFKTWRAAACDRCHGANQEGLVGPSLVNSLKVLTKQRAVKYVPECGVEFESLGLHPPRLRQILLWRIPKDNPRFDPSKPAILKIPFLLRPDEEIEDSDEVLLPLLHPPRSVHCSR